MATDPRRELLNQHMTGIIVYTVPEKIEGVGEEARQRVLDALDINREELLDRFMRFLDVEMAMERQKMATEILAECKKLKRQRKQVGHNLCRLIEQKYVVQ